MELGMMGAKIADEVRFLINDIVITAVMMSFLGKMYQKKYRCFAIYTLAYIITVFALWVVSCIGIPIINAVASLVLINTVTVTLYVCNKKLSILYNLCFTLMALIGDIVSATILAQVRGKTIIQVIDSQVSMYISSLLSWIVLFLSNKLLIAVFKKEERTIVKLKELLLFVCITMLEISVTAYSLNLIESSSSGNVLALVLAAFFVLNVYITYLIKEAAKSNQLKYELALSQQQVNMQLRHYKDLTLQQEKAQKTIHDAKKHILAVEGLFLSNFSDKGSEYTRLLCERLDELTFDFKCSNQLLGIIISAKLQEAEKKQIKLSPCVSDISMDFINDLDITAIFANLLDNSFEECVELPVPLRHVKLSIRKVNEFIVINVSNPVRSIPVRNNRVFMTSKAGHEGVGLSNVLTAVEKYNGNFIAEVSEGDFVVKITIPIVE